MQEGHACCHTQSGFLSLRPLLALHSLKFLKASILQCNQNDLSCLKIWFDTVI